MRRRRIVWLLSCAFFLILFLFGNDAGTLTLLSVSALLPVFDILLSLLTASLGTLSFEIAVPEGCVKKNAATVGITVKNKGLLPVSATFFAALRNTLTGENLDLKRKLTLPAKSAKTFELSFIPEHCGEIEALFGEYAVGGALDLVSIRRGRMLSRNFTVFPELFPCLPRLSDDESAISDAAEYSSLRPGNDPSETFAIREYVPGDPIRTIHWKLSEKAGKPMVRELARPISEDTLVLCDTASNGSGADVPALIDSAVEIAASVSHALADSNTPHRFGWINGGVVCLRSVCSETDFHAAITEFLTGKAVPDDPESARFFGHILIVSAGPDSDAGLSELTGGRVTVVSPALPSGKAAAHEQNGVLHLSFEPDSCADEFACILI